MDTDIKELLTLAAKACGQEVWFQRMIGGKDQYGNRIIFEPCLTKGASGEVVGWAPHLDDGDGARMEAKLGIAYKWWPNCVYAFAYSEEELAIQYEIEPLASHTEYLADHNNDRQAARRWASFRAAAQIGKGMTP